MLAFILVLVLSPLSRAHEYGGYQTRSGLNPWVDVDTPESAWTALSSRGDQWELVMSDEFNRPNRNFSAGQDHLWTAIEMPDGVNAALEYYSTNMTSVVYDDEQDIGYFQITVDKAENITFEVYNTYKVPPGYEWQNMYYRSGMVQSWNTFCLQGGLIEVRSQLPGAITSSTNNPDLTKEGSTRLTDTSFYPAWPGIWLLGNLGRALFTSSTSRMWPWTFDECDEELQSSQRISACNSTPGHGLNPNQGRGAPEIDILEGGGTDISSSIQIAPGMPEDFRVFSPNSTYDGNTYCIYGGSCVTPGANYPGIPTSVYDQRSHKSWYQGLRYGSNILCETDASEKQSVSSVKANAQNGFTENNCQSLNACPASKDGYSDLSEQDVNSSRYWGINNEGKCFPVINGYMGTFLCDPISNDSRCSTDPMEGLAEYYDGNRFAYQMDALSANWPVHLDAYLDFLTYKLEWVTGSSGYLRWMLDDTPLYEITAESIEDVPQDASLSNPRKKMLEEPLYIIFNVALSTSWGTSPPNAGGPCEGDGSNTQVNNICSGFPMYLKVDYIRLYQDTSESSKMSVGCDPTSHPTKEWINDNLADYVTAENPYYEIIGGASCNSNHDCSIGVISGSSISTGLCVNSKCSCTSTAWQGPRCTTANVSGEGYGPSLGVAVGVTLVLLLLTIMVIFYTKYTQKKRRMAAIQGDDETLEDGGLNDFLLESIHTKSKLAL